MKKNLKVAIVHDWLTGFRGGERVLEAICELFPEAEIYTLIHKKGSTSPLIESKKIHVSFLNKLPGIERTYRSFLPLFPYALTNLNIPNDVDLVISSSHCVAKGIKIPEKAFHISYIHSPMRYIYDQFDSYFGKESFPKRFVGYLIRPYLQTWDFISNSRVNLMVANSSFVAERIKCFYGRNSEVVHPFVELSDFQNLKNKSAEKKEFYLMVSALAPNKRIDLAVEAFRVLGKELYIVGSGQDDNELRKNSPANVHFLGQQSREKIVQLMSECRAFIFPGVEDFGITPLEALAAGSSVIAFHAGGVLETLNEEVATFFYEPTPESLIDAINLHDPMKFKKEKLFNRALEFSKVRFQERILSLIGKHLSI